MDGLDGLKHWKCRNGHVLGVVQRIKTGDYHITRLILFRQAIDLSANGHIEDVDVLANIEGTTLDVRCSVPGCSAVRSWYIGEDAMERLLARYRNSEV